MPPLIFAAKTPPDTIRAAARNSHDDQRRRHRFPLDKYALLAREAKSCRIDDRIVDWRANLWSTSTHQAYLTADGGGKATVAGRPLFGADAVGKLLNGGRAPHGDQRLRVDHSQHRRLGTGRFPRDAGLQAGVLASHHGGPAASDPRELQVQRQAVALGRDRELPRLLVQARVRDRDRRMGGEQPDQLLVLVGEVLSDDTDQDG